MDSLTDVENLITKDILGIRKIEKSVYKKIEKQINDEKKFTNFKKTCLEEKKKAEEKKVKLKNKMTKKFSIRAINKRSYTMGGRNENVKFGNGEPEEVENEMYFN